MGGIGTSKNERRWVNGMPLKRGWLASLNTSSAIDAGPVPANRSAAGPPYGCMMGGRRSLHEFVLASGARIVVEPAFDNLCASDEASVSAEASAVDDGEAASGRVVTEPEGAALLTDRSVWDSSPALHAVRTAKRKRARGRGEWQAKRLTGGEISKERGT